MLVFIRHSGKGKTRDDKEISDFQRWAWEEELTTT